MSRVSSAGLFVRINLFRRFIFRKNVHADFYGLSDIDSVVTDFYPNNGVDRQRSAQEAHLVTANLKPKISLFYKIALDEILP